MCGARYNLFVCMRLSLGLLNHGMLLYSFCYVQVAVCSCDPAKGQVCGEDSQCLNRSMHIECTKGFCPAGDLCRNQRLQHKKENAKLQVCLVFRTAAWIQLIPCHASECALMVAKLHVCTIVLIPTYNAKQSYLAGHAGMMW